MTWTKQLPTRAGFYWFRNGPEDHPCIVEVVIEDEAQAAAGEEAATVQFVSDTETYLACDLAGDWAGPILLPLEH
jgi:hypothetical protein